MSNFMKIRPVRAELFHSEGQTDTAKITAEFHNFANGLKNCTHFRNFCW